MLQRLSVLCVVVAVSAACGAPTLAQSDGQTESAVVASVGDRMVTMDDLDAAWRSNDAGSRLRMLQELYETRRRTLDVVVGEILVEREAIARGTSRDELLAQELPSRTPPVTDEEISLVYQQNRNSFPGQTEEQLAPQILAFLEQQRPMQALHAYMNELRDSAANDIRIELEPPRTEVSVEAGDPVFGPDSARVEIIEFSDFQCPYCQRLTETLQELKEEYGDDIRLVFKDYPLPNHAEAFKAAEAGLCANEQGKFWELHDAMFENQNELGVDALKRQVGALGLDQAAFDSCLDSDRFADEVRADLLQGQGLGVSSTPTVFVNGRAVLGAAPFATFDQIIREELAR